MVIQELGIHSVGGSNVCFADKKGLLLPDEVHLSRLISFKQLFCRPERARGSGHKLLLNKLVLLSVVLFIYEAPKRAGTFLLIDLEEERVSDGWVYIFQPVLKQKSGVHI